MSDEARSTLDLDRPENRQVASREWWAERIGWVVIAGILLAALLGAFGPGPISHREAVSDDGRLTVEFYRVQRYSAPAELRISFDPRVSRAEIVEIGFSQSLTDKIKVESIAPQPIATSLEDDRVIYAIRVADLQEHGHVVCRYQHESFGPLSGTITLLPSSEVELSQFVYP